MFKKLLIAAATLGFSGAVLADPPHWAPAHGWRAKQHYAPAYRTHYYAPRPVVVMPAPRVVYAPPPPVVYPYYAAPAPVVVRPAPVYGAPTFSIRLNLPL